jgi:hypothetical protein
MDDSSNRRARIRFGLRFFFAAVTIFALSLGYRTAQNRRIAELTRQFEAVHQFIRDKSRTAPPGMTRVWNSGSVSRTVADLYPDEREPAIRQAGRSILGESASIQLNVTEAATGVTDEILARQIFDYYVAGLENAGLATHFYGGDLPGADGTAGLYDVFFNDAHDLALVVSVSFVPDNYGRRYVEVRMTIIDCQQTDVW